MATIKRVVTIVMEIDTEKHDGIAKMQIREDGKAKKWFTPSQAVATARTLSHCANELLSFTMGPLIAVDKFIDKDGNLTLNKK